MNARLLFLHALSPLHAGVGQGVGVIDLPIAREKATGLPFLPGSSVKGTLRDSCTTAATCLRLFGPEAANAADYAGSAQFSDQRLLLLPIRSLAGTFAWVTAPLVLRRLARDAADAGLPKNEQPPSTTTLESATVRGCRIGRAGNIIRVGNQNNKVVLEDLDLDPQVDTNNQGEVTRWAQWLADRLFPHEDIWRRMLTERLCVIHDDAFAFLLNTATEITARVALKDDTKTVDNLWYEEALPTETILAGLVVATPVDKSYPKQQYPNPQAAVFKDLTGLVQGSLQFGGKATVGRGICRLRLVASPFTPPAPGSQPAAQR